PPLSLPPCSLLAFHCYVDHRDLPSFPTRRSSDLCNETASCLGMRGTRILTAEVAHSSGAAAPQPPWPPLPDSHRAPVARADPSRSEEHTSELQSRFDLVCRLLLEKKKTVTHPRMP